MTTEEIIPIAVIMKFITMQFTYLMQFLYLFNTRHIADLALKTFAQLPHECGNKKGLLLPEINKTAKHVQCVC